MGYEVAPCGASSDAQCASCRPVAHCPTENTVCRDGTKSDCLLGAEHGRGACEENYLGNQCCWKQTFTNCGSDRPYRVRSGRAGGYGGQTNDEFIEYCRTLCEEFPDCIAFDAQDRGHNDHESGRAHFKTDSECNLFDVHT